MRHRHIEFKGPPAELVATSDVVLPRLPAQAAVLEFGGIQHRLLVEPLEAQGRTRFVLRLPPGTPPGRLKAVMHIGGDTHPAIVDVEARASVAAEPRALRLDSLAAADLDLENQGNVEVALQHEVEVRLRPADAMRHGARAFCAAGGDAVNRFVAMGRALSDEPVALATLAMDVRGPALATGERRCVALRIRLPDDLDRSHEWVGSLALPGTDVSFTVASAAGGAA